MKNRRLIPLFVSASLFTALGFGALSPASAQPAPTGAQTGKAGRRAGGKGMSKRMVAKIEEKMGKPLTVDQKTRLAAAAKIRATAVKDAQDKFNQEASTITGLSVEDLKSLGKRDKMAGGKMGGDKMAPAPR